MAQTNYTPISLYYSTTASAVPTNTNLVNGELAINITDGKLYYKDSGGVVTLLAQAPSTGGTFTAPVVIEGTTTSSALRITQLGTGNALLVEDSANPDSTPFVIDTNGKVVSGSTTAYSATAGLIPQIASVGNTNGTASMGIGRFSADVSQGYYVFTKSRSTTLGTFGSIVSSGDAIGTLLWTADDGTAGIQAASITASVDGTPGTNDMPGRLVFSTTADGASASTERMRIDNAGAVGIGSTSLTARRLVVGGNMTGSTGAYGVLVSPTVQPDVTASALISASQGSTAANGGTPYTVAALVCFNAGQGTFNADSTVTSQYGFAAAASLTGATNNYGFHGSIASGTGRWNLYMNGTANNYLAGSLGIGSTTLTQFGLRMSKTITGAVTSYGVLTDGAIQSDVTTASAYYGSSVSTQAAAFTLGNLRHYQAVQGTFGAGSIVSIQSGFLVDSTLIGATTNYGLLSNIASPTSGISTTGTISSISSSTTTVTVNHDAITYTNGQTVTISATANATALVSGATCTILTVGSTDFTLIGAASNTVGVSFTATGAGTGTGTVTLNIQGSGKTVAGAASGSFTYTTTTSQTFAAVTVLTGSVTVSKRYNLYMNGTADNYLAGNVGIGKNTPTTKLEVAGAVANALIRINRTDNAAARGALQWTGNDDVVDWQIGTNMVASGGLEFSTAAASGLLMTLDTTGNLGIGTSSPSTYGAKLAVYSAASSVANIQITNPGVGTGTIGIAAASSNFKIYNSYASGTLASGVGIDIDTAGNVGIGTTSPAFALDVAGNNGAAIRGGNGFNLYNSDNTNNYYLYNIGATGAANAALVIYQGGVSERMRIDSSGNVGIGVTPTANFGPLQVYTSTNGTAAYLGNGAGVHAFNGVGFYSSAATLASSGVWTARSTGAGVVGASNAGTITFYTDTGLTSGSAFTPTTRMTIDGSGNVGIGISSSIAAPLQVYNATAALIQVDGDLASNIRVTRYSTDTNAGSLQIRKSRGTYASPAAVASGDTAAQLTFSAYGGTNYRAVGSISSVVDTFTSDTNISGYLTLNTNSGSTTVTEKMRIDSSGNVGIGTSSPRLATGYTSLCLNNATTGAFIDFSVAGTRQATITTSATVFDFQSALTSPITFSTNGANERMRLDSVGNLQVSTGAVMHYAPAPTSIAAATTLTNAQIQNQIINTTGTTYTVTMPLGTTLETLATWATTNISYDFYVINTASGTITIGANSNTTLGSLTIATGVSAQFRIRRTAANAFTIYRLG